MPVRNLNLALARLLVAGAVLSAALAALPAAAALPKPIAPPAPGGTSRASSLNDLPDSANPISYQSVEGQFSTTFPTGCARLRTRMNMGEDGQATDGHRLVFATCDRYDRKGEGCQVIAELGALGQARGQAAVDLVLKEVGRLMAEFAVKPVRQAPVSRDFGPHGRIEGLDIQAQAASGSGDVWIRGLMRDSDIYVLVAWRTDGGLFQDPEYARFFDDFQPWAE